MTTNSPFDKLNPVIVIGQCRYKLIDVRDLSYFWQNTTGAFIDKTHEHA